MAAGVTISLRWLLGLSALLGTASSSAGQTIKVRDATGRERRCQPAIAPKPLPSLAALVDTAAFLSRVAAAAPTDSAAVSLGLVFAESAILPTVRYLEPPGAPPAWLASIATAIRPQPAAATIWAVRLRIATGAKLITVERSVYCPPERADEGVSTIRVETSVVSGSDPLPRVAQKIRLEAEVTLSESGSVTGVQLLHRSGNAQLDESFLTLLQQSRYLPAMIDGLPIPSWIRTTGARLRL